jgi:hypothetical protein
MQIESPFGKVEISFINNHYCVLHARGLQSIKINGVELNFFKDIAIIDGRWQMVEFDGKGGFYISSNLNLKFHDWQRYNESPSKNAREKLYQWINCLISDLTSGVYNKELNKAERIEVQKKINSLQNQLNDAKETIERCKTQIDDLNIVLNNLPK